jgi:hypothetical protein
MVKTWNSVSLPGPPSKVNGVTSPFSGEAAAGNRRNVAGYSRLRLYPEPFARISRSVAILLSRWVRTGKISQSRGAASHCLMAYCRPVPAYSGIVTIFGISISI